MVYVARALVLRDDDRPGLERLTRVHVASASLAVRARTVLLASEGTANVEIGRLTGLSQPSVLKWRTRYAQHPPCCSGMPIEHFKGFTTSALLTFS